MIKFSLNRLLLCIVVTLCLILLVMYLAQQRTAPIVSFIASDGNQDDIYLLDLNTRHPINLTETNYPEWSFEWADTGTLAYTASVNPAQSADELFVMTRLGEAQMIDTPDTLYSFGGVWSPDGSMYAYFSSHPRNISDLFIVRLPELVSVNLTQTDDVSETNPLWSPIGTEILYRLNGDLHLIDVETGASHLVVDLPAIVEDPVWSPDGQWIIAYNRLWDNGTNQVRAYLISRDGQDVSELALPTSINSPVTWSPDNQQIALITEQTQLTIYDLPTQQFIQIDGDTRRFAPSWSPDGNWIAFIQNRHLYAMTVKDNTITPLLTNGRIKPPLLWYPR